MPLNAGFSPALPDSLVARELRVVREVGAASTFTLTVDWTPPDGVGVEELFDEIVGVLATGGLTVAPDVSGSALLDGVTLTVTGAEPAGDVLHFSGSATSVDRSVPDQDPLAPRYRVHSGKSLLEVLDGLGTVAVPSAHTRAFLGDLSFADEGKSCVVQAGISDWELYHRLLDVAFEAQQADAQRRPVLTGSLSEGNGGRWVVTWNGESAYEKADRVKRKLDLDAYEWKTLRTVACDVGHGSPHGAHASFVRWRSRPFEAGAWSTEVRKDLPLFDADGHMVWRIDDRLELQGDGDVVWRTRVETMPAGLAVPPLGDRREWVAQQVLATVSSTTTTGAWIEVEFPGFEPGANKLSAKVCTPYAGVGGTAGINMVPENGTEVLVVALPPHALGSNALRATAVAVTNVREADAALDSPSLSLAAPWLLNLSDVTVHALGDATVEAMKKMKVETDLNMTVSGKTDFKSGATTLNTGMEDLMFEGGNTQGSLSKGIINLG